MPRETRICLMPQAICFNNSSSVICAVPFTIVAQIEHFIQNFTMTYLSFQQKCFRFVGNIDQMKNNELFHIITVITNHGFQLLKENSWSFRNSCQLIGYDISIIPKYNTWGKTDPTETIEKEHRINILMTYAKDNLYLFYKDEYAWTIHEFFHTYCFSQFKWDGKIIEKYNYFKEKIKNDYPGNFGEYVPYTAQFAYLMANHKEKNISEIISYKKESPCFESYCNMAKEITKDRSMLKILQRVGTI